MTNGPLKRKRYINDKIELELIEFKKEIEEKFAKSALKTFVMPRKKSEQQVTSTELAKNEPGIFNQSRI